MTDLAQELAGLALFAGVDRARLAAFGAQCDEVELDEGQTLLRQGEAGDHVLLVLDGQASVETGGVAVGVIGAGDCVGEMAVLDDAPRSATVAATGPLRALAIPAATFHELLETEPPVAARLTRTLAGRLRQSQTEWASLASDPEVLLAALIELQDSPDPAVAELARAQAASLVKTVAERAPAGPDPLEPLTPAERRVVALVAEGLSNGAIAEQLFVSRHTVDTHVKHTYTKLGIRSRVELAALVLRRR